MHSIEIDHEVHSHLASRATGFHVTPNDVLRGLLGLSPTPHEKPNGAPQGSSNQTTLKTISEFVRSGSFQQYHQAIDRFLAILAWIYASDPKRFADVAINFHRGRRRYFGKSQEEVEDSGEGISAKHIPNSPFWVLTTLDNKSKRAVIEDLLRAMRFSREDVSAVVAELPDSNIRRRRRLLEL